MSYVYIMPDWTLILFFLYFSFFQAEGVEVVEEKKAKSSNGASKESNGSSTEKADADAEGEDEENGGEEEEDLDEEDEEALGEEEEGEEDIDEEEGEGAGEWNKNDVIGQGCPIDTCCSYSNCVYRLGSCCTVGNLPTEL
jgi:hypothetical protein